MNQRRNTLQPPKQQRGAILLVALVLLLIMTIAGVATIESIPMQAKMAANQNMSLEMYQSSLSTLAAQYNSYNTNRVKMATLVVTSQETESVGNYTESIDPKTLANYDADLEQALDLKITNDCRLGGKEGNSINNVQTAYIDFELHSETNYPNTSSHSTQELGLSYEIPAGCSADN